MTKHALEGDFAELALAVYVEELAIHKRVLFVGDPTSAAPERLARNARSVDVVSTRSRVRGTRRGGRVASRRWPGPEDAGHWDLVIVPDLPAAGLAADEKIEELARWLAPGGVLVAGTPDPHGAVSHANALSYETLFDLLDPVFEHVRMLGQAPFAGYSVVDFAPASELEVTFDGSILEGAGESAQRYYALGSDRELTLDAYAVVQVPSAVAPSIERPREERADGRGSELAERLREQQDALDAANVHAEEIERELEEARGELDARKRELEGARARVEEGRAEREALEGRARELEAQLEALSKEESNDEEYARLEAALHERGRELTEMRVELERRATLVRDVVEELREARGEAPAAEPKKRESRIPEARALEGAAVATTLEWTPQQLHRALHGQLDEAVQRAVAAEAEKAELAFRLDEVRGELAMAERRFEGDLEELRRVEAALRGTVRGLNARLSEVLELYQLTQARLALAEDDRAATEVRNARLVRELAEVREQLELEIARARMSAGEGEAPAEPAREGRADEALRAELAHAREQIEELSARQRAAREEAERAAEALSVLEQRVEGMRAGYETRVAELVRELDEVGGQAERALVTAGELRSRLDVAARTDASLRGELSGLKLRLADREEAVAALSARGAPVDAAEIEALRARLADREADAAALADARAELDAARARLAERDGDAAALSEARSEVDSLRERLAQAEEAGAQVSGLRARVDELTAALEERRAPATVEYARDTELEARIAQLTAMVSARDSLVARLQRELADAAERRASIEARLEEHASKLATAREELEAARAVSAVSVQEGRRELDDLAMRLERTERERQSALEGLEEARGILEQLALDLPRRDGKAGTEDAGSLRQLRDRLARLDAEAADREVLLRSLTAQLQERDDRIRALERLTSTSGEEPAEDASALQQRLLEMEERVARLSEELEHERDARRRAESGPS